ncbi:biotin transporter BioY [Natronobeatus ordinarius]|uniref:biotin transporter BioY n=1 Tax=Natronobeatus ordinarius TaxID=2963433 RepID=UPI0020CE9BD8|nr:biotin transporter BioY [Natronobeatus ordinarius]
MATQDRSVELVDADVIRSFARAALLAALTGALAYVSIPIPFSLAPISLGIVGIFLAGLYLGPRWGTVSILLYLAAGAAGAPIFANGNAGLGILFGRTGGYLWSYPIAAFVIGATVHGFGDLRNPADASIPVLTGGLVAGTLVIYTGGVLWFMWLLEIGLREAIAIGAAPFVVGEVLKIAATVAIAKSDVVDPT